MSQWPMLSVAGLLRNQWNHAFSLLKQVVGDWPQSILAGVLRESIVGGTRTSVTSPPNFASAGREALLLRSRRTRSSDRRSP